MTARPAPPGWREPLEGEDLPVRITGIIEIGGGRATAEESDRPRVPDPPTWARVRPVLDPGPVPDKSRPRLLWLLRWGPELPPHAILATVTGPNGGAPVRWPTLPELSEALGNLPRGMLLAAPPFVAGVELPPIPVIQLHPQGAIRGSDAEIPQLPRH